MFHKYPAGFVDRLIDPGFPGPSRLRLSQAAHLTCCPEDRALALARRRSGPASRARRGCDPCPARPCPADSARRSLSRPLSAPRELLLPAHRFAGVEDIHEHRGILTSNKAYLLSIRDGKEREHLCEGTRWPGLSVGDESCLLSSGAERPPAPSPRAASPS